MSMDRVACLGIGILIILILIVTTSADDRVMNSLPQANTSPVIFTFTAASPVTSEETNITVNSTDRYKKNSSVEAYYNNISQETDTSLPRLIILGIPMECHFC